MPLFEYIASDAQGGQHRGQLTADDKNDLLSQLQKDTLFLVSFHEVQDVEEGTKEHKDQGQSAHSSDPADSEEPQPEQPRWPIKSPSQIVWMALIFVFCVFLGYLIGR